MVISVERIIKNYSFFEHFIFSNKIENVLPTGRPRQASILSPPPPSPSPTSVRRCSLIQFSPPLASSLLSKYSRAFIDVFIPAAYFAHDQSSTSRKCVLHNCYSRTFIIMCANCFHIRLTRSMFCLCFPNTR